MSPRKHSGRADTGRARVGAGRAARPRECADWARRLSLWACRRFSNTPEPSAGEV